MSIGEFAPIWLDGGSGRLYAALHCPVSAVGSTGVLSVPPLLHEQPRSRRFITEVASGLAALGLPCLRFDFAGTGDSAGNGAPIDFASMGRDLDVAAAALRSLAGVDRVVVLAWRGAALVVDRWLRTEPPVDQVVLWEPIVDGSQWLATLVQDDAAERARRPRQRPGVRRTASAADGQLMGFAASPRLRRDLEEARLMDEPHWRSAPTWAVIRRGTSLPPIGAPQMLLLPPDARTFESGVDMEATFFLSPALERVVDGLGHALLQHDVVDSLILELQSR